VYLVVIQIHLLPPFNEVEPHLFCFLQDKLPGPQKPEEVGVIPFRIGVSFAESADVSSEFVKGGQLFF